jgi:hypothetical protein
MSSDYFIFVMEKQSVSWKARMEFLDHDLNSRLQMVEYSAENTTYICVSSGIIY